MLPIFSDFWWTFCRNTSISWWFKLENCPWSRIEVRPTASWPWPWLVTFSFNPLWATVVTHTHAKYQVQRSVGSKDRVETDGGDCITSCANAVSNYNFSTMHHASLVYFTVCCIAKSTFSCVTALLVIMPFKNLPTEWMHHRSQLKTPNQRSAEITENYRSAIFLNTSVAFKCTTWQSMLYCHTSFVFSWYNLVSSSVCCVCASHILPFLLVCSKLLIILVSISMSGMHWIFWNRCHTLLVRRSLWIEHTALNHQHLHHRHHTAIRLHCRFHLLLLCVMPLFC